MATDDPTALSIWPMRRPEEVGFPADLAERFDAGIRSGLLRNLHAVLVARGDALVLERYYEGIDENWGQPIGVVAMQAGTLHDLRSVTKSVTGLLYGIALDRGLVPPPDASLFEAFPEYGDLATDRRHSALTVGHALTMTLGQDWDETLPYTDPANSEIAMENAPDRLRYVLGRPFIAEPGSCWIYSGGAVALVGALIERGTKMRLDEFARQALFEPLGISAFEWNAGSDGVASAASGLRLRARDLLAIGALVLGGGEFRGRRVVSKQWIDASLTPATETGDGLHYGCLWYIGEAQGLGGQRSFAGAFGNGGQRLWLMPSANLIVVTFSNAYNAPDSWITPARVWREIVLG